MTRTSEEYRNERDSVMQEARIELLKAIKIRAGSISDSQATRGGSSCGDELQALARALTTLEISKLS